MTVLPGRDVLSQVVARGRRLASSREGRRWGARGLASLPPRVGRRAVGEGVWSGAVEADEWVRGV